MPRRVRSDEDSDSSWGALQTQKRILQLKRERDERIQIVVEETDAAMEDLRSRIMAHHGKIQKEKEQQQAQCVMSIIELAERRKDIEVQMVNEVIKMCVIMRELEEMMLAGYDGRLRDAKASKGRLEDQ